MSLKQWHGSDPPSYMSGWVKTASPPAVDCCWRTAWGQKDKRKSKHSLENSQGSWSADILMSLGLNGCFTESAETTVAHSVTALHTVLVATALSWGESLWWLVWHRLFCLILKLCTETCTSGSNQLGDAILTTSTSVIIPDNFYDTVQICKRPEKYGILNTAVAATHSTSPLSLETTSVMDSYLLQNVVMKQLEALVTHGMVRCKDHNKNWCKRH